MGSNWTHHWDDSGRVTYLGSQEVCESIGQKSMPIYDLLQGPAVFDHWTNFDPGLWPKLEHLKY